MTQRQRFREFIRGASSERMLPFPIYKTAFIASTLGRRWATDITLEESRDVMMRLGCVPSVTLGEREWFPANHPLSLQPRLVSELADRRDYATRANTPHGDLCALFSEVAHQSLTLVKSPCGEPEDFKKLLWYLQQVRKNTDAIAENLERVRIRIGEDCLLVFFLPQPYELYCLFSREEAFYLQSDHPELFADLQSEILATVVATIKPAIQGGADLMFFGSAGTELYSPEIFRRHVLPCSLELAKRIRAAGGISTFHLCGCGKEYLDMGAFEQMDIDILEGLGTSETGNIPSVAYICERVPRHIILRGNVPLQRLLRGTQTEVAGSCREIVNQMDGRKHILSGECDLLFGTPPENIRTLSGWCG